MTPDYDYGAQTSYILQLFCFFVIMFVLCYWYDQKTGIQFTGSYNFHLRLNLGTPKLVWPKSINWCPKQPVSTPAMSSKKAKKQDGKIVGGKLQSDS